MSNDNIEFSVENFMKKVQEGDTTLLVIGALLMIVPLCALFFLVGGKAEKKATQYKLKATTQRKNVFNFASKQNGKNVGPKSDSTKRSIGGYFSGTRTVEQKVSDELNSLMKTVENSMKEVRAPSNLSGDAKRMYEAEHNFYLCMGNGAIEEGNYSEAEKLLYQAIDDARGNPFLIAYAYGSLCHLYETTGDRAKLEEAYRNYFKAVKNVPEEFGGGDLEGIARNAFMMLKSLNQADMSKVADSISNNELVKHGDIPSNIDIKNAFKSFPVQFE